MAARVVADLQVIYTFNRTEGGHITTIVGQEPSCSCTYQAASREKTFKVCLHLYAVYTFDMQANINLNMAIHQVVLTHAEARRLIGMLR